MTVSDDLFQLVKSLSKPEKIYFKKFASLFNEKESNNYLKLFNEIDKQVMKDNFYDEAKIKKGNYSGKFLKNISYHKNYLYNIIMTSLSVYQRYNRDSFAIRNLIIQSEILSDKLLYEQSLKVLLRAKKKALENEIHIYLLDILNKERVLNKHLLSNEESNQKTTEIFKEQFYVLDILKNNLDYYVLNDHVGNMVRKIGTGFIRSEKEFLELEKFFDNPLLKDIKNAKTFFNKTLFNTLNLHYCTLKNDFEKGYNFTKENVGLWEKNIDKKSNSLENYLYALNNFLTCQIRTKRFDECEVTARKMKELYKKYPKSMNEKNRVFIFYSTSVLMISKYLESWDPEGLERYEKEVQDEIGKYENKLDLHRRIILYYFLGTANFVLGNFEKCINWMGNIINLEKTDLSQDYQCYARIVYLISYYESGYFDSLEYAMKSAYHFISKKERIYKYENLILKYLRKSFKIKSHQELNDMFKEMKFEMEMIVKDPFEQNAFDAFNILPWLESKIKNVSMRELLKQKKVES